MLNAILFIFGCTFIGSCALLVHMKEGKEIGLPFIGFEDYIEINPWELHHLEPIVNEEVADMGEYAN